MKYNSFIELEKDLDKFLETQKLKEALAFLEEWAITLPKEEQEKRQDTIINIKMDLFYECGMYDEFFSLITCMHNRGYSCPLHYYDSLDQDPRYIASKEKNEQLLIEDRKKVKFQYIIYLPENYSKEMKYPIFFNLHGNGDNIGYHKEYWKPESLSSKGFIVVYLQSSQINSFNHHYWVTRKNDGENVVWEPYASLYNELKACYNSIAKEYSIDDERIIIGGFSGGAMCALDIAVANVIPIKGAIALCSGRLRNFTAEYISAARDRGIKLVFMEGGKDERLAGVVEIMEKCKENGLPFQYYINEGIGHWYPEDIDDKCEKALNFILE